MATWGGTDNFDSYSTGDLNGGNGGSGWAGAWSGTGGVGAVNVSTAQKLNGANSAASPAGTQNLNAYDRTLTTTITDTSTILHVALWSDTFTGGDTGDNGVQFYVMNTAATKYMAFGIDITSNRFYCRANNGSDVTVLSSPSTSTWYHCYLDIDATNWRCRGYASTTIPNTSVTFSSYSTGTGGAGTIDHLELGSDKHGHSMQTYFDDIRDGAADFLPAVVPAKATFLLKMI